eukprot:s849_g24.t1
MSETHIHAGGRRKNQDYSACLALLPEGVWSRILKAPSDRLRADELAHFLYTVLQLRLPTEGTYGVLTGLLASFDPTCTSFDLRTKLQTVKTAWANMKVRLGRTHTDPPELLRQLPSSFAELPDELRARFGEARPMFPWPIDSQLVDRQTLRVPIRSTHASLQEEKKHPMEALADLLLQKVQNGRSTDLLLQKVQNGRSTGDSSGGLKNLKIFSPTRRSIGQVAEQEKQTQLQIVNTGRAPRSNSVGTGGALKGPLCLEDQPRAASGSTSAPAGRDPEAISVRDGGEGVSTGELPRVDALVIPARDDPQPHVPSRDIGGQHEQQGAPKGGQDTYEVHASQFLVARQAAKGEKAKAPTSSKEEMDAKGITPSGGKGLKRPASAMKRPAAKRPREEGEKVTAAEPKYENQVFHAKTYGKCKVEYYTHKSYIRQHEEEAKKWVMVVGSTHPKHHKKVCALLVPHVKGGLQRDALLRARAEILTKLGD